MAEYIFDLTVVSLLTIGITAFMGPLLNGIGKLFFGSGKRNMYADNFKNIQQGWNKVGGKNT